jgi:hypothetical protein
MVLVALLSGGLPDGEAHGPYETALEAFRAAGG